MAVTENDRIGLLLARSSLGTPEVKRLRARTPAKLAAQVAAEAEKIYARLRIFDESQTYESSEQPTTQQKDLPMSKRLTPGTIAPRSGQYQQRGPRGGEGREVTVVRGEPLPPTTMPGSSYVIVDPTKNKSGQR